MAKRLFSQDAVSAAHDELESKGYTFQPLPGSLLDPFVAIAPDDNHYNFVFDEVYLNEWSSAYSVRRCGKISKALERRIQTAYDQNA